MSFGVERARGYRCAKRGDRIGVPALPRECHSKVERRIRILGPRVEYDAKGALGLRELLLLKRLPPMRESDVYGCRMHPAARVLADSSLPRAHDTE